MTNSPMKKSLASAKTTVAVKKAGNSKSLKETVKETKVAVILAGIKSAKEKKAVVAKKAGNQSAKEKKAVVAKKAGNQSAKEKKLAVIKAGNQSAKEKKVAVKKARSQLVKVKNPRDDDRLSGIVVDHPKVPPSFLRLRRFRDDTKIVHYVGPPQTYSVSVRKERKRAGESVKSQSRYKLQDTMKQVQAKLDKMDTNTYNTMYPLFPNQKIVRVCPCTGVIIRDYSTPLNHLKCDEKTLEISDEFIFEAIDKLVYDIHYNLNEEEKYIISYEIDHLTDILAQYFALLGLFDRITTANDRQSMLPSALRCFFQKDQHPKKYKFCPDCKSMWRRIRAGYECCCHNFYGQVTEDKSTAQTHAYEKVIAHVTVDGLEKGNYCYYIPKSQCNLKRRDFVELDPFNHPHGKFILSKTFHRRFNAWTMHYQEQLKKSEQVTSTMTRLLQRRFLLFLAVKLHFPLLFSFEDTPLAEKVIVDARSNLVDAWKIRDIFPDQWIIREPWKEWTFLEAIPPPEPVGARLRTSSKRENVESDGGTTKVYPDPSRLTVEEAEHFGLVLYQHKQLITPKKLVHMLDQPYQAFDFMAFAGSLFENGWFDKDPQFRDKISALLQQRSTDKHVIDKQLIVNQFMIDLLMDARDFSTENAVRDWKKGIERKWIFQFIEGHHFNGEKVITQFLEKTNAAMTDSIENDQAKDVMMDHLESNEPILESSVASQKDQQDKTQPENGTIQ